MQPYTPQDVTGDGAVHTLAALTGISRCRWFQVTGISIGAAPARIGPSTVALDVSSPATAGIGFPIVGGGSQFAPPVAMDEEVYDLEKWYAVATTGDVLSVGVVV